MAAPKTPGPNHPAADIDADLERSLGNLLPQPVYQVLRNHFLKPHDTVHVTQYFFHEWFARLGLQRWLLVLILREALQRDNHQGVIRITREELAKHLECSEKTITDLLRHIPHPTRKGWRAIDPSGPDGQTDPRRKALSLFIPRLRYWYEKNPNSDAPPKRRGFIIAVSMDDPLTPEDEARIRSLSLEQISNIVAGDVTDTHQDAPQATRLPERTVDLSEESRKRTYDPSGVIPEGNLDPSGTPPERLMNLSGTSLKGTSDPSQRLKGSNDPILLTLTELTRYIQEDIDKTLTTTVEIRRAVAPLIQLAENALADFHSTGMFYRVLYALYPDHLELFVQAIREALEVGQWDQHANLGAIFVESIKMLAQQAGVDLGFGSSVVGLSEDDEVADKPANESEGSTNVDGWTADELWQQALSSLQLQMPKATFDTWLYSTHGIDWDGDCLVVELRSSQAREWVENRIHPKIVRSVRDLVGHDVQVAYELRSAAP